MSKTPEQTVVDTSQDPSLGYIKAREVSNLISAENGIITTQTNKGYVVNTLENVTKVINNVVETNVSADWNADEGPNAILNKPNLEIYTTRSDVDDAIANLINSAPGALNTLGELANALGNSANYASTITNELALKASITYVDDALANISDISIGNIEFNDTSLSIVGGDEVKDITIVTGDNKQFVFGADGTLTVPDVIQSSVNGIPKFASATDIILEAVNRVKVQGGTFKLASKTNGERQLLLPQAGDMIYNSTVNAVQLYTGSVWVNLGGTGFDGTGNIAFSDTTLTSSNGNVKIHFSPTASPAVEFNFAESGEFTAGEVTTRLVRSPSQIMSLINTDGVGVRIDSFNQPTSIDIGDTSTWDFVRLRYGAGSVTGNDGDVEIRSTPMGSPAAPSAISISPQGGENGSFTFGGDGSLNLPTNLKIAQLSTYGPSSGTMMIQAPNESMHIVTPGNDSHLTLGWSSTNSLETAMLSINADSDSLKAVKITTGNNATTLHGWVFGSDGTLTVPGLITKDDNLTLNSLGADSGYVAAVVADGDAGRVFVRTDNGTTTKSWEFGINGDLKLPAGGDIVNSAGQSVLGGGSGAGTGNITFSGDNVSSTNNIVNITGSNYAQLEATDGSFTSQIWTEQGAVSAYIDGAAWTFSTPTVAGSTSNAFEMPNGIMQRSGDNVNCVAGVDTVIYTSALAYNHTVKLLLNIEGVEDGQTDPDTQSCEMIVAKGVRANSVAGSAYGLVYTSTNPLVTLSTRWNAVASRVEITCRPVSLTNQVSVRSTGIEVAASGAG